MPKYDVIVVGSGFGGGTVGFRLTSAGYSVLMLERGRRWQGKNLKPQAREPKTTPFPEPGDPHFFWGRKLWPLTQQRMGLYEMLQFSNLQGVTAAGVGGGSLIWANVVVEAPEWVFEDAWPDGVSLENLRPYYGLARQFLRPSPVPGVPGVRPDPAGRVVRRAELHQIAAERLGKPWRPVDVAVNFADEVNPQPNGFGSARQLGCNYCGLCSAGCPQNAKNTVDLTCIAAAEARGMEVRTHHQVRAIEPLSAGGYRVHFRHYDEQGRQIEAAHADAPRVVLCAGSFATTELLLRSRTKGLLPHLSPALGTRFSVNGNVVSGALDPQGERRRTRSDNGPAIASLIDFDRFAVEDIANPTWAAGLVGEGDIRRVNSFLKSYLGFKTPPEKLERMARDLLVYVGVGFDRSRGKLYLNALGQLSMSWRGGLRKEPVIAAQHKAMAKIAEVLGRRYVPDVFSTFGRPVVYHPLGGCPMADTAEHGVVDQFGRVYGYPGLFVADGSIMPTALARNPSYTICALSERIAERMI